MAKAVRIPRSAAISSADSRRLAAFCQRHGFDQQQVVERLIAWLAAETQLVRCAILQTPDRADMHGEIAQRILHRHTRR